MFRRSARHFPFSLILAALGLTLAVAFDVRFRSVLSVAATLHLAFVEVQRDGIGGVDGLREARSVAVSPDGNHVYVAGFQDDALAVFGRDAGTGALTFVEIQKDGLGGVNGLNGAISVTVSPDGAHVYAVSWYDQALALFSRDAGTGRLTFLQALTDGLLGFVDGLYAPTSVTVSPDGVHVYVTSGSWPDDSVAVFWRNQVTGLLAFREVYKVLDGVQGLDGATSVTVSPDGAHVYVTGSADNAVVVFSRDAGTNALTFVEVQEDGVGGVDGLRGAASVTVSPDGAHVYAVSSLDDAVAVFDRDAGTGALTFVEVHKDGVGGVDGLFGARSVMVHPDGAHVYVASYLDDAVAVFGRDAGTGALTFVEVQRDGVGGVDGLHEAFSLMVSPDGDHVYVAGREDDAVAVFERKLCGNGLLDPGEACDQPGEQGACAPGDVCTNDCAACVLAGVCGNGATEAGIGEECDDGGESASCDADCTLVLCGDGELNTTAGEVCDDGDLVDGDGCDSNCTPTGCGNAIVTAGEECDDGGESASCDADCTSAECGDGTPNAAAGEECDDGDLVDGDGCDSNCTLTGCGNAIVTAGEECDDGGESASCDADCTLVSCGDGTLNVTAGEECDDGNTESGDGCQAACLLPCPEGIADCLGAADQFALVADKVNVASGRGRSYGYSGYTYHYPSSIDGLCATKGTFKGGPNNETYIYGDLVLLGDTGTAARFKPTRLYGNLEQGTEVVGDLITGGGSIKGLEWANVSGVVDTTGTHPKLDACRQAMLDMQAGSDLLRDLPVTQDLGTKLTVPFDELVEFFVNETLEVFRAGKVIVKSKRYSYPGYSYFVGGLLNIWVNPNDYIMVFNIADALTMQRESVFHFDPGDPRKAIVNLHGDKPRIKLEQALTDGETIVGFPVLAPRGKFLGKANSYVCGIYASRVRLKGVTVFHRSACGP